MTSSCQAWLRQAALLGGLLALLLLVSSPAHAQLKLKEAVLAERVAAASVPSNPTPQPGENISVAITVDTRSLEGNDVRLAAYEATLTWRPDILEYTGFTPAPAPWNNPNVQTAGVASGKLGWNAFVPGGDAPGLLTLIHVNFRVIGAPDSSTTLNLAFSVLTTSFTRNLLGLLSITSGSVRVTSANRPPQFTTTIPDTSMDAGDTLAVAVAATDPDGDAISLTPGPLPAFAVFVDHGDGTGTFRFTPGFDDYGIYPGLQVTATDNGVPPLSASTSFTLTVRQVENPPRLEPIADQTMKEGDSLVVGIKASDPDGDDITLAVHGLPAFGTFIDNNDGSGTIIFTPDFTHAGDYRLEVTASDDGTPPLTDRKAFTLTVNNVNRAPVLQPVADQTMSEGSVLELILSANDPDQDSLVYFTANLPAFGVLFNRLDGTALLRLAPSFRDAGVYNNIVIAVRDNGTPVPLADSTTFSLTVTEATEPLLCQVKILSPASGFVSCDSTVTVCFSAGAAGGLAPLTKVCKINGEVTPDSCGTARLTAGRNTITVACTFTDATGTVCVAIDSIHVFASRLTCQLQIDTPADSSFICATTINVSGTLATGGGLGPVTSSCDINGTPVTVGGGAFGATVNLNPGYNTIIATCTQRDSAGCETVCTDRVVVFADTSAPQCTFDFSRLPLITGEAIDEESGILRIEPFNEVNRVVIIEPFAPGARRVRFRSERTQPQGRSGFMLKITNMAGCEIVCDPIYLSLNPEQAPVSFSLPPIDRYLFVNNHGLERIEMRINQHDIKLIARAEGFVRAGNTYFMPFHGPRTIDLEEYLRPGENDYTVAAFGSAGSSADFLITDFRVDDSATGVATGRRQEGSVPTAFILRQNYPNPFNPATRIVFEVPAGWTAPVTLRVFNLQGQLVQTLFDGYVRPGQHTIPWQARTASGQALPSGVYFYQIRSGDFVAVRKMLLEK
ncbi:MAG: Ig-like domain-containing protein [candidate division KSB1 bacterium]|nr:Ig-like domain-containing protein [candidate division KSB1 bacterium]MDZ7272753.1 Ig-like domain-containing protein [candidate division KSB1 bacterium]MDZ7284223.1 Ig-like domain-containing protein [candidate division KSB1 bacterium]MDZ7297379.1 Ig-like domain-containing protein [candidate division KSB1 bacterium]MDZ7348246.1 Ig-like domain-containing protein [candidate division KSB1 bacterium]